MAHLDATIADKIAIANPEVAVTLRRSPNH